MDIKLSDLMDEIILSQYGCIRNIDSPYAWAYSHIIDGRLRARVAREAEKKKAEPIPCEWLDRLRDIPVRKRRYNCWWQHTIGEICLLKLEKDGDLEITYSE